MSTLTQELVQLQAEFEALIEAWNTLATAERRKEWDRYLDAEDQGGAGWHRFARLLVNSYCEGWCPLSGVQRDADGLLIPALLQAA